MLRKVQTNMWGEETARKLTNGAEDPIPVPKPLELKTNPTSPDSE